MPADEVAVVNDLRRKILSKRVEAATGAPEKPQPTQPPTLPLWRQRAADMYNKHKESSSGTE